MASVKALVPVVTPLRTFLVGCIACLTSAPAASRAFETSMCPAPDGEEKRREARRQNRLEVRFGIEQKLDDFRMSFRGRPHDRSLPILLLRVNLGSRINQSLDGSRFSGAGGGHQRRFAAGQSLVRIGAVFQKSLDNLGRFHWCRRAKAG